AGGGRAAPARRPAAGARLGPGRRGPARRRPRGAHADPAERPLGETRARRAPHRARAGPGRNRGAQCSARRIVSLMWPSGTELISIVAGPSASFRRVLFSRTGQPCAPVSDSTGRIFPFWITSTQPGPERLTW